MKCHAAVKNTRDSLKFISLKEIFDILDLWKSQVAYKI